MLVRPYQSSDIDQIVRLFFDTIHTINRRDYMEEEVNAWAPGIPDPIRWAERYKTRITFVAEENATIAGFAELEPNGHIDCFYCHHAYQGQGVGRRLYNRLEQEARSLGIGRLYVEASITAKPFFERMGFQTLHQNQIPRGNVILINFSMEKYLNSNCKVSDNLS